MVYSFHVLSRFSSVQWLSHVLLFSTPGTAACQASLSITNSQSLLKLMSMEPMMPSNHLILCCPLLLLPSIFPSIKVFSNESALRIRHFRCVQLFATSWAIAWHTPLSMGILQARVLEWVAMPSSRGFSQPRDQTLVSCIAGWFFPAEPLRNPYGLLGDIEYYMCSDVKDFEIGFISKWWRSRIRFPFVLSQNRVQFKKSCWTFCDPMDWSILGLPFHCQLLEFTQTPVHWVGYAIQSSHPLSSPSPPAFNLSKH